MIDNPQELNRQVQIVKEKLKKDFYSMKRGVEILSDAEVSCSTLDCVIFLFLKSGLIDENGDRIPERSRRRF